MSSNFGNRMYSLLPPFPLYDNYNRVVVISDSEYREYKQKQARDEILVLQNRRNRYEAAIVDLNDQIAELEKAAGIETSTTSTTLSGGSTDGVQQQE